MSDIPAWLAAIVATLTFFGSIGILIWAAAVAKGKMEAAFRRELNEQRKEIDRERDLDLRTFGESLTAIRNKMGEMELWNRDNFARRDSVHMLGGRLETQMVVLDEKLEEQIGDVYNKIETRFDKLDAKIDTIRKVA